MAKNYLKRNPLEKKVKKIKNASLILFANGMIPSYLAHFVNNCDLLSHSEDFVRGVMELQEHSMRVAGYYRKYPAIDKEVSKSCKQALDKLLEEERR